MAAETVAPFSLDDFARSGEPTACEPSYSRADLDRARNEGLDEGLSMARTETSARIEARLGEIAALLERERGAFETALDEERERLAARAGAFLERFAKGLAAAHEIDIARDMLSRLLSEPRERTPAALAANPATLEALCDVLNRTIEMANAADFVSLEADPALRRGDFALRWNGGGIARSLDDAIAAIDDLFPHSNVNTTKEPAS